MSERNHYQKLIAGATLDGWTLIRIADGSGSKNPFDFFGWTGEGIALAVEGKEYTKVDVPDILPKELFKDREHQITWLNLCANRGGISLIPVYHKRSQRMLLYGSDGRYLFDLKSTQGCWRGWPVTPEWVEYLKRIPGAL